MKYLIQDTNREYHLFWYGEANEFEIWANFHIAFGWNEENRYDK